MSDMELINQKIKEAETSLLEAERYYHHAIQFGTYMEWNAALAECRDLRANLIALVKRRDELLTVESANGSTFSGSVGRMKGGAE